MSKFTVVVATVVLIGLIVCSILVHNLKKNVAALDKSTLELCLQVQEMEQMLLTKIPHMVVEELDCEE